MSKTTILIPNYNGIKYIAACLDSIKKCGDYPVVVVDNGSTDGSAELIENDYPEITLIKLPENTGFCHAVNVGLKHIGFDNGYVFLLNNDTEVDPKCIEILENRMDKEDTVFSMQAKILNLYNQDLIDDCGDFYNSLGWAFAANKDKSADSFTEDADCFACCGAAVMYRLSLLEDIGCFDENHFAYLEDIDIGYRARLEGYRNVCIADAIVYHAGSATSGSRYNKFKVDLSARNNVYLIYKNMPILQWLLNFPFLIVGFGIKTLFFILKGMGGTYVLGLMKGIWMCLKDIFSGRKHKVKVRKNSLGCYARIQLELWVNMFKRR